MTAVKRLKLLEGHRCRKGLAQRFLLKWWRHPSSADAYRRVLHRSAALSQSHF